MAKPEMTFTVKGLETIEDLMQTRIQCVSTRCQFFDGKRCSLKEVLITDGKCHYYNKKIVTKDE